MHPANDDGVGLKLTSILSRRLLQLHVLAFVEEVDLGVDAQLPARGLGLGHHGILRDLV